MFTLTDYRVDSHKGHNEKAYTHKRGEGARRKEIALRPRNLTIATKRKTAPLEKLKRKESRKTNTAIPYLVTFRFTDKRASPILNLSTPQPV